MTRTLLLASLPLAVAVALGVGVAAPLAAQDADPVADPAADPAAAAAASAGASTETADTITVRNVARAELERGLAIVDSAGRPLGTVAQLDGADVILDDATGEPLRVPIVQLYAARRGGVDTFASRLPRAQLVAQGRVAEPRVDKGG